MQLYGKDAGTGGNHVHRQRAVAGADIEHQFARSWGRLGDDKGRPFVSERVPSPPARARTRPIALDRGELATVEGK